MTTRILRAGLALAVLAFSPVSAGSAETTLRAMSGFAPGTTFSAYFESFIKRVNERGKGQVQIHYVGGGGKVMDPFEMGNAVRTHVVDIVNIPGSFYTNIMPEADALKMIPAAVYRMKGTPAYRLLEEIHNKKANAHLLARQKTQVPFHLFLTKKIDKMDLAGLKLRVTPIYAPFFAALGGTGVRLAPGDVFVALERGVVDGYGWPLQGIFDLGWQEATKYRVDPGFYNAADEILVNLPRWQGLSPAQTSVLEEAATWMEKMSDAQDAVLNKKEMERQRQQGIQVIAFEGADGARYLKLADQTAWEAILKAAPEYGPKLRQALGAAAKWK